MIRPTLPVAPTTAKLRSTTGPFLDSSKHMVYSTPIASKRLCLKKGPGVLLTFKSTAFLTVNKTPDPFLRQSPSRQTGARYHRRQPSKYRTARMTQKDQRPRSGLV